MVNVSTAPPLVRVAMRLDLRPLHSALARAESVLDVLEICQATGMMHGGAVWLAACTRPIERTFACGAAPLTDAELADTVADMEVTARTSAFGVGATFAREATTRWRDLGASPDTVDRTEYAQIELVANGASFGLLRVLALSSNGGDTCDWEAVESVMCAAAPHIVLTLQREQSQERENALRGLCPHEEFTRRVEGEVDRVQSYGAELTLVMLEVQVSPDRAPGDLTKAELKVVGEVLESALRTSDLACRLPDGRFSILLPLTGQRNALIACARVIDEMRARPEFPETLECRTGVSGWAFDGPTGPELFRQATQALEDARSAGARGAFVFL